MQPKNLALGASSWLRGANLLFISTFILNTPFSTALAGFATSPIEAPSWAFLRSL
jgi:hypothetical protein